MFGFKTQSIVIRSYVLRNASGRVASVHEIQGLDAPAFPAGGCVDSVFVVDVSTPCS